MDNPIVPPTGGFVNRENILSPETFLEFARRYPKKRKHYLEQAKRAEELLDGDTDFFIFSENGGKNADAN